MNFQRREVFWDNFLTFVQGVSVLTWVMAVPVAGGHARMLCLLDIRLAHILWKYIQWNG